MLGEHSEIRWPEAEQSVLAALPNLCASEKLAALSACDFELRAWEPARRQRRSDPNDPSTYRTTGESLYTGIEHAIYAAFAPTHRIYERANGRKSRHPLPLLPPHGQPTQKALT